MSKLDVEQGDTLVITMGQDMPHHEIDAMISRFDKLYKDQQVNIVVLSHGTKLDIIKSSNLADSYDSEIRQENPALQEAWDKYQTVKGLTK